MKTNVPILKTVAILALAVLQFCFANAQVNIPLNNSLIYYDGVLFPIITSDSVILNRHTPLSYAEPSSGIVYAPCNLTRATQSGVRIRFKTASPKIVLNFGAQKTPEGYFYNSSSTSPADGFTVSVNGVFQTTFTNTLSFTVINPQPGTSNIFEINLPVLWSVVFKGLTLDNGYTLDDAMANNLPKYAAFGTSISMGTGQNNSTQTYPYQIAKQKNWNLYNFAVAGSTIGWQLAYNLKGKVFDYITIEQGFNNWASQFLNSTLENDLNDYGKLVDSVRKFQPNAKIYCIAPIATSFTNPKERYSLQSFRTGINTLVSNRNKSGDNNIYFIDGSSISEPSMTADGIHLSVAGAKQLANSLVPLLGPRQGLNKGYIPANDAMIQYTGRFDFSNTKRPTFSFPGTSIKAKFQGTSIKMILKDYATGTAQTTNYFNIIIDNNAPIKLRTNNVDTIYSLANALTDTIHSIEIFKRTESSVGKCDFRGFVLDNNKALITPSDRPKTRIEFIGDSYTCGYGNEVSIPQTGNPNTGFNSINENNYNAWGAIASRTLKAEYVCTAYSGRGLYRNNTSTTTGLIPQFYTQTIADQNTPTWDHNSFIPNILVLHLGTNDFFPVSVGKPIDSVSFVSAYINFVNKLRGFYPTACIVCAVPNGLSDYYPVGANNLTKGKKYIKTVVDFINKQGDSKVYYFLMTPQGSKGEPYGEDYHPSFETHQIMANDFVTFINSISDCATSSTTEKTPTISFADIVKTEGDAAFLLNANSNSNGEMTYSIISGANYASVTNNGQVNIIAPGVVLIKVNQAASTGFAIGSATAKLTILSKTGKDTLAFTQNLAISNDGSWSTQVDALGSQVNSFSQLNAVKVDFDITPKTSSSWPWVVLSKNVGKPINDLTFIKITYKSNLPIQLSLPQAPLSLSGESYSTTISASENNFNTLLIPLSAFSQPSWATNKLPLDLNKITALNFAPLVSDASIVSNATIEIQNLVLYKSSIINGIENTENNSAQLISCNSNEVQFYVHKNEAFKLKIYDTNGVLIDEIHNQANNNIINFSFNKLLAKNKLYLFFLENDASNHTTYKIYIE